MPRSTNCSSEPAKWPFLSLSRASSSAMIIFGPMKRQRDVIRERTVRPVSSPRATARRGHASWSYCRLPMRRPAAIQSGLRFRRRSNRQSNSTTRGAGSSYPSTTLTNGRTLALRRFREAGRVQLWLCSARLIRADQNQIRRAGSPEQERRGAPLIARNTREVSDDPRCPVCPLFLRQSARCVD